MNWGRGLTDWPWSIVDEALSRFDQIPTEPRGSPPAPCRWVQVWQLHSNVPSTRSSPSGPVPVEAGLETKTHECRSSNQTCYHRHGAGWGATDVLRFGSWQTCFHRHGAGWGATVVAATLPDG